MSIFKLTPVCKDYIWGGTALIEKYGKITDAMPCAESWELSLHPDGITRVGTKSIDELLTEENLGKNASDFDRFPMLVKLIDAKQNLSVQVHPSDDYALENENSYGKTEMWYIVEADESAGIYLGFSEKVTIQDVRDAIAKGNLEELLSFVPVKAGECYFIPAGTVHAICAGCLICEIQQNSNITYRVYDYCRRDKNGLERPLHIDRALDVSALTPYTKRSLPKGLLGISKYFTVKKVSVSDACTIPTDSGSFVGFTVVRGSGQIGVTDITLGDSVLVGADEHDFTLTGDMDVLTYEVRKYGTLTEVNERGVKVSLVNDLGVEVASVIGTDKETARVALLESAYLGESDLTL